MIQWLKGRRGSFAKAEKNGISVGKGFAKTLKIFDNIDHIKNRGVI
jgi:hypothetical protein